MPDTSRLPAVRPRSGRWPAYRRTFAPAPYCNHCWSEGGPPVPGEPFVWGYPSLKPGEGRPSYYCAKCADSCRRQNIVLIPLASEDEFRRYIEAEAQRIDRSHQRARDALAAMDLRLSPLIADLPRLTA